MTSDTSRPSRITPAPKSGARPRRRVRTGAQPVPEVTPKTDFTEESPPDTVTEPACLEGASCAGDEVTPYEVGYGKPPRRTRFPAGVSGNPRGRPKRRPMPLSMDLAAALSRRVTIVMNGRRKKVTVLRAIAEQRIARANQNDEIATRELFQLIRLDAELTRRANEAVAVEARSRERDGGDPVGPDPDLDAILEVFEADIRRQVMGEPSDVRRKAKE